VGRREARGSPPLPPASPSTTISGCCLVADTPYVPPRFPPLCVGSNLSGEQMSHSWQAFESGAIRYLIKISGK
ncbi:unnamed protein product, partial [Musa textilis]